MTNICSKCGKACDAKASIDHSILKKVFHKATSFCCDAEIVNQKEKTYPVYFTENELEEILQDSSSLSDYYSKIENVFNEINKPQIGDRCAFWDDDEENHVIGWYNGKTIKGAYEVKLNDVIYVTFKNCAKIKKDAEF